MDNETSATSTSGEATLEVTANNNNIQISNFGSNSFKIANTGNKNIAQVDIDVTNALYPDSVFDPFGVAGDQVSKALTIDTNGSTGVVASSNASYIGAGGTAGFEGLRLLFNNNVNGGFQSGETLGFSVDMDPNSIAGANKGILDSGANPAWDVGGVSGAELIGSRFTVTFTDGTTATGQLQGAGNQGGSRSLASQDSDSLAVDLRVNGFGAGGVGTYNGGPAVSINGPAGQTARVVLTKGFIQPQTNAFFNSSNPTNQAYAPVLQSQLDALAASDFPANNAVEFQTVDVSLTGGAQDISGLFNFAGVAGINFAGEDQVPLGFVASVIDPSHNNLPIGPVTAPVYLTFGDNPTPSTSEPAAPSDSDTPSNAGTPSDSDTPSNADETGGGTPIRLEAENTDSTAYRTENIGVASGGQVLTFLGGSGNEEGSATFGFNEAAGAYDIVVGTFDENDGVAQFVVELNDMETGTTTEIGSLELDASLGSNLANAQTSINPTIASDIELTPGDRIIVNGFENGREHARLDYIELRPNL